MPRSIFLGRVVAEGEPLWLAEDRSWALALAEVESDTCACGQPRSDGMNAECEDDWRVELRRCHACATAARTMQDHQDKGGDAAGLHVYVAQRK